MRARSSLRHAVGCLVLGAALGGCGAGHAERGPHDALRAYAAALEERRVDDAYQMLSEDARRTVSLEAFRRMVLESPAEVLEIARALSRPASEPEVTATVVLPSGDELLLVLEGGRWKVDGTAVELYGQATPRQALLGFLRAFEQKRYDMVLRYVPDAEREGVPVDAPAAPPPGEAPPAGPAPAAPSSTPSSSAGASGELTPEKLREAWEGPQKESMSRLVQALRAALPTASIEESGDVASMSYGSGGTVSFVRERGAWKIRDF